MIKRRQNFLDSAVLFVKKLFTKVKKLTKKKRFEKDTRNMEERLKLRDNEEELTARGAEK